MADGVTLSTGHTLPTIGLGVYQLEASLCTRAVENALRIGYRHIDSAQYYRNETEVGRGLHNSEVPREQVFITLKVYATTPPEREEVLKSVDESVEKLGSNYYDLFLIHSLHGGRDATLSRYKALLEAKRRGMIRNHRGVELVRSDKHIKEILEEGLEKPTVNQIEVSDTVRNKTVTSTWCQQRPIVSYCKSEGIVVQAHTPLVRGSEAPEGKGIKSPVVLRIAAKHGKSPAQVLIRWSLQKGYIPLPKASSVYHIEENFRVFDFVLDTDDVAVMDALDRGASGAMTWNPLDIE